MTNRQDIVEELDIWSRNRLVNASVRALSYRAAEEIKRLRAVEAQYIEEMSAAEDKWLD